MRQPTPRILKALQEDGRLTNQALADKVGLSHLPLLAQGTAAGRQRCQLMAIRPGSIAARSGLVFWAFIRVKDRQP
nr:winged helix-turn-helix domain-containing protein [uncultured Cohaesibacter sp.]